MVDARFSLENWDKEDIENVGNGLKWVAVEKDLLPLLQIAEDREGRLQIITNGDMPWHDRWKCLLMALGMTVLAQDSETETRHEMDFPEGVDQDGPG